MMALDRGSTMLQKVRKWFAPSSVADSNRSLGIVFWMKVRAMIRL